MSIEVRFFARLLTDAEPATFTNDFNLGPDMFWTKEGQKIFSVVQAHLSKYHALPSLSVASVESGIMIEPPTPDPLAYWVDQLQTHHRKRLLTRAMSATYDRMEAGDVDAAEGEVLTYLKHLSEQKADSKLLYYDQGAREAYERFKRIRMEIGLTGVTFGFPYLDKTTRGAQPGDMIVIAGRPKEGKTWTLLHMANAAFDHGHPILIITTEQTHGQIIERVVCMRAGVNARSAQLGRISNMDLGKVKEEIERTAQLRDDQPFYIYKAGFRTYIQDVSMLIRDRKPAAVYIDGAYLLRTAANQNEKVTERVSNVAEDLKNIAREAEVPIFATYQFNRQGAGKGRIYQSDAVEQLASVLFGLKSLNAKKYTQNEHRYLFKELNLIYGREGEKGKLRICFDTANSRHAEDEVIDGYIGELDEGSSGESADPDIDLSKM